MCWFIIKTSASYTHRLHLQPKWSKNVQIGASHSSIECWNHVKRDSIHLSNKFKFKSSLVQRRTYFWCAFKSHFDSTWNLIFFVLGRQSIFVCGRNFKSYRLRWNDSESKRTNPILLAVKWCSNYRASCIRIAFQPSPIKIINQTNNSRIFQSRNCISTIDDSHEPLLFHSLFNLIFIQIDFRAHFMNQPRKKKDVPPLSLASSNSPMNPIKKSRLGQVEPKGISYVPHKLNFGVSRSVLVLFFSLWHFSLCDLISFCVQFARLLCRAHTHI